MRGYLFYIVNMRNEYKDIRPDGDTVARGTGCPDRGYQAQETRCLGKRAVPALVRYIPRLCPSCGIGREPARQGHQDFRRFGPATANQGVADGE